MSDEALRQAAASITASADSMRQTQGFMDESLRHFLVQLEDILSRDRESREASNES